MAGILRGDIYWADLNPVIGSEQGGLRPALVLSHNVFNERSGTVIAVALASQRPRAGFPLTLELNNKNLPKKSWVKNKEKVLCPGSKLNDQGRIRNTFI